MEWAKASTTTSNENQRGEGSEGLMMVMGGGSEGVVYPVRVMTDEQMEILRQQIGMYAEICEQLIEMHKSITAHNDTIAGMRLGNLYCDPLMISGGTPKISARQRWTPTPVQLQILESIFEQGNGTPNKQKIKEITSDLLQHGQITETNVYNWFQNRRARSKRKQATSSTHQLTDAEAEAEAKGKLEKTDSFRSLEGSSEVHSLHPEIKRTSGMSYLSNESSKSSSSIGHLSFYEQRMNQTTGEMDGPGGFSCFQQGTRYNMNG